MSVMRKNNQIKFCSCKLLFTRELFTITLRSSLSSMNGCETRFESSTQGSSALCTLVRSSGFTNFERYPDFSNEGNL